MVALELSQTPRLFAESSDCGRYFDAWRPDRWLSALREHCDVSRHGIPNWEALGSTEKSMRPVSRNHVVRWVALGNPGVRTDSSQRLRVPKIALQLAAGFLSLVRVW